VPCIKKRAVFNAFDGSIGACFFRGDDLLQETKSLVRISKGKRESVFALNVPEDGMNPLLLSRRHLYKSTTLV
jgi:hypothetical protein